MKNLLLFFTALFTFVTVNAQVEFGVSAGFHSISVKAESDYYDESETIDESGFIVGVFADFALSDKVDLRPALFYSEIEDYGSLLIPVMAKFNVAEKFYLQAGPQFAYFLDDLASLALEAGDELVDEKKLAIQIGVGGIYQINDNIELDLRYAIGVSAFEVTGEFAGEEWKDTAMPNSLIFTLNYKFN